MKPVSRRLIVWACVLGAIAGLPRAATAQRAEFLQTLNALTDAIEGTYGDEGSGIEPLIERLSLAVQTWDRQVHASGAQPGADGQAASLIDKHIMLARMNAERGWFAEALHQLDAASSLRAQRADVLLFRGMLLEITGNTDAAGEAFRAAWGLDRSNPLTAYYVLTHVAGGDERQRREGADAMAAGYRLILKDKSRSQASPFLQPSFLPEAAGQAPLIPLAAYREAYARIARGDLAGAVAQFRSAAATDPVMTDPATRSASMKRAAAALRQGRLTDARMALDQPDVPANSSEVQRLLGLIAWVESDHQRSIQHLESAVRSSPLDERSRLALARVLSSAGREADAGRVLEETIRILPGSARAHLWLASSYERLNRYDDARRSFEAAAAIVTTAPAEIYASIGRLASAAADLPGASDALTRAVRAKPNDAAMHVLLATALLQQDRIDEAFAEFVAALLIDPRSAAAHAGIGHIHLDAGRYAEAVGAFRRATELAPGNTELQYALAAALARAGNADEARQYFVRVENAQRQMLAERRRTLSIDVMKEEAALRSAEGDYDRAAALWEQVIAREPDRAAHHAALGAVLAGAGRRDSAIERYEKAIALGAEPAAYLQLAALYAKAGRAPDAARARVMYEKALQGDRPTGGAAR